MGKRNPLEVLGAGALTENQSLKVEGSSIIYSKGNNQTVIPIGSIKKVTLFTPNLFRGNGSLVFVTSEGFLASPLQLYFRSTDELEYAQNIQKYITDFQANASAPVSTPQISVADELVKLKALVDDGILTQEEFDKKKSKLLGE